VRKIGFLLSRRWLVFALVVAALTYFAWWLGEWQFDRLEQRRDRNATIERNEQLAPAAVTDVLAVGSQPAAEDEWRKVTATGAYETADTVIVRYRTRDGASGVNVVVPLRLDSGELLVVDRGWYATDNRGASTADVPAPPAGEVEVQGWVRADATGNATKVSDHSTRAISSDQIGDALDEEMLGGFVQLAQETPEPDEPLVRGDLPELDEGPHFFYGLQWWFFGALAVFGFGYLLYDELRRSRTEAEPAAVSDPKE
jgi:cytochrome oxidase assembly protein ShyY1